jgi:hypothetical protein
MLALLLAFFYSYRALAFLNLRIRLQQGLLVGILLLTIILMLRQHVYQASGLSITDWIMEIYHETTDPAVVMPGGWVTVIVLVYLWARGIQLARRSLSPESVGLTFRIGVVVLMVVTLLFGLFGDEHVSGFVAPYFFFALSAVALARIEQVSAQSHLAQTPFGRFWIGSTVLAVALLMLLSTAVALFFYGGGLGFVLRLLSPLFFLVQILVAGLGVVFLWLFEAILSLFAVDMSDVGLALRDLFSRLGELVGALQALSAPHSQSDRPAVFAMLQFGASMAIPIAIVVLVLLLNWFRVQRSRRQGGAEIRESTFSTQALARDVLAALRSGWDRLGQLAGLVNRFGLGSRFLSAITIRRIYINMERLATGMGYPRLSAQTPYEYLATLRKALPGVEDDVQLITEAYVNAHYGQVPDNPDDLQRIRECWERVRGQGSEPPETSG